MLHFYHMHAQKVISFESYESISTAKLTPFTYSFTPSSSSLILHLLLLASLFSSETRHTHSSSISFRTQRAQ